MVAACDRDRDKGPDVAGWLAAPIPAASGACSEAAPELAHRTLRIAVYYSKSLDTTLIKSEVGRLRAHLGAHGLTLIADRRRAVPLTWDTLLSAGPGEVEAAVRRAGLDPQSGGEDVGRVAATRMLGRARNFLRDAAAPPTDRMIVVFARELVAADSPLRVHVGDPLGLTFSPHLADSAEASQLDELLGSTPRAPAIFIDARGLSRLPEPQRAEVLLHEFGHAFGLEHDDRSISPMGRLTTGCARPLTAGQLQVLGETLPGN